ncbi:GIY-YIG nuclease family protein [Bacillus sp. FJAT-29953]|nr:GIY-YIG nuclease family protein [Bacillus sp. FJAT-29953]
MAKIIPFDIKIFGKGEFFVWQQAEIKKFKTYGVYIFYDIMGDVIYVGRAVNLGDRVFEHIHAKTGELARNKKNITTKKHYSFLYKVKLIELSTEDYMWFEAYTIAKEKPVFNKDLRSDLPDDKKRLNEAFNKGVQDYYENFEERSRLSSITDWTYYQRETMRFYSSKGRIRYSVGIEDVVLMHVFKAEVSKGGIKFANTDLIKFNWPKSVKGRRHYKEEIINYILLQSKGWTRDNLIDQAKKIGMTKQDAIQNLDATKFLSIK